MILFAGARSLLKINVGLAFEIGGGNIGYNVGCYN